MGIKTFNDCLNELIGPFRINSNVFDQFDIAHALDNIDSCIKLCDGIKDCSIDTSCNNGHRFIYTLNDGGKKPKEITSGMEEIIIDKLNFMNEFVVKDDKDKPNFVVAFNFNGFEVSFVYDWKSSMFTTCVNGETISYTPGEDELVERCVDTDDCECDDLKCDDKTESCKTVPEVKFETTVSDDTKKTYEKPDVTVSGVVSEDLYDTSNRVPDNELLKHIDDVTIEDLIADAIIECIRKHEYEVHKDDVDGKRYLMIKIKDIERRIPNLNDYEDLSNSYYFEDGVDVAAGRLEASCAYPDYDNDAVVVYF